MQQQKTPLQRCEYKLLFINVSFPRVHICMFSNVTTYHRPHFRSQINVVTEKKLNNSDFFPTYIFKRSDDKNVDD